MGRFSFATHFLLFASSGIVEQDIQYLRLTETVAEVAEAICCTMAVAFRNFQRLPVPAYLGWTSDGGNDASVFRQVACYATTRTDVEICKLVDWHDVSLVVGCTNTSILRNFWLLSEISVVLLN